jgi:DNA polymerase-4
VSGLAGDDQADPVDLINLHAQRTAAAEHAVDRLRDRFGDDAVIRGLAFEEEADGNRMPDDRRRGSDASQEDAD